MIREIAEMWADILGPDYEALEGWSNWYVDDNRSWDRLYDAHECFTRAFNDAFDKRTGQ